MKNWTPLQVFFDWYFLRSCWTYFFVEHLPVTALCAAWKKKNERNEIVCLYCTQSDILLCGIARFSRENKNKLRTFQHQKWKKYKNSQPQTKFTGSYKKKGYENILSTVVDISHFFITWETSEQFSCRDLKPICFPCNVMNYRHKFLSDFFNFVRFLLLLLVSLLSFILLSYLLLELEVFSEPSQTFKIERLRK